jgi:hypothetical protein
MKVKLSKGDCAMHERFFSSIREHMDVYDANGDKVGTVGKIFQPTAVGSTASTYAAPTGKPCLKVDTGFMGLGKDLYIPADAIRDVTGDGVIISTDKDHFDAMGWDRRPDFLRD